MPDIPQVLYGAAYYSEYEPYGRSTTRPSPMANHDVYVGFVNHLKRKFGTTDALNKAWFMNYWGEDINSWEDVPTRDDAQSTGYKLEWSRWQQLRVTDFLAWQAALVREYRGPHQFVTTDFGGVMKPDVNENAIAAVLDIPADNVYHAATPALGRSHPRPRHYFRDISSGLR